MPVLTSRAFADPYTQADIPVTASAARGAAFEEAITTLPGYSAIRAFDLNMVRVRGAQWGYEKFSKPEAEYFMEQNGLKGEFAFEDRTYNQGELSVLAKRKSAEIKRREILARAEGSGSSAIGRFGITLATNFLDPVAVGSAFVPVVGQARYAGMLGRAGSALGRAGVRARVGALEGAAGAALLEPLIASAKFQEQADYTFADSFLNMAIGTAFGGGLHVTGGAVGDRFRPQRVAAQLQQIEAAHTSIPVMSEAEQALASRVTATRAEMQAVQSDILRASREIIDKETVTLRGVVDSPASKSIEDGPAWSALETQLTEQRANADAFARRVATDYEPAAVRAEIEKLTKDVDYIARLRGKYRQRNVADRIAAQARENVVSRRTVLETKLAEQRLAIADTQAKVDAHRAKNAAEQRLEFIRTFGKTDDARKLLKVLPPEAAERLGARLKAASDEAAKLLESPEVRALTEKHPPASWIASQADPRVREAALRARVGQMASDDVGEVRPFFDRATSDDAARRVMNVDERPLMDPAAVIRADEVIAAGESADLTAAQAHLADTEARVKSLLDEMGLNAEQTAEFSAGVRADIDEATAAVAQSKDLTRAADLMVSCSLRHAA